MFFPKGIKTEITSRLSPLTVISATDAITIKRNVGLVTIDSFLYYGFLLYFTLHCIAYIIENSENLSIYHQRKNQKKMYWFLVAKKKYIKILSKLEECVGGGGHINICLFRFSVFYCWKLSSYSLILFFSQISYVILNVSKTKFDHFHNGGKLNNISD